MAYAVDTSVSVERSKAEIERLLVRYGADHIALAALSVLPPTKKGKPCP